MGPVIVSDVFPCFQMGSLTSHRTPKREKEGKKEGKEEKAMESTSHFEFIGILKLQLISTDALKV